MGVYFQGMNAGWCFEYVLLPFVPLAFQPSSIQCCFSFDFILFHFFTFALLHCRVYAQCFTYTYADYVVNGKTAIGENESAPTHTYISAQTENEYFHHNTMDVFFNSWDRQVKNEKNKREREHSKRILSDCGFSYIICVYK